MSRQLAPTSKDKRPATMPDNPREILIGFYPTRPFWAGPAIDLSNPALDARFGALMSEVVFSYKGLASTLAICKDGLIMLRVHVLEETKPSDDVPSQTVAWWGQYLDCVNCAYLLLDSTVLQVMTVGLFNFSEITQRDVISFVVEHGRHTSSTVPVESIASAHLMARHLSPSASITTKLSLMHRTSVPQAVFDKLAPDLDSVLASSTLTRHLATIARSLAQYKIGNYSTSVVLAWFVIESVLSGQWRDLIADKNVTYPGGDKRVNADRHQTLTGRAYPISVVSSMLELHDRLSFPLFKTIDRVRGYRNAIVHQDKSFNCSAKHCQEALELARQLATDKSGPTVLLNLSWSVMGTH